jgi:glycosyltransferase involved in cell wall biosynthesis
LHQAGTYGKAAIIPKIGDLKELVEEEGFAGEYFEPGDIDGMADAIEKLLTDDAYRVQLAKKNFVAAASLPMSDICEWYLLHFNRLLKK